MPWPASTVVERDRGTSPFRRDERRAANQLIPSLASQKVIVSHGAVRYGEVVVAVNVQRGRHLTERVSSARSASEAASNRKELIELQREFSVLSKQVRGASQSERSLERLRYI